MNKTTLSCIFAVCTILLPLPAMANSLPHRQQVLEKIVDQKSILAGRFVSVTFEDDYLSQHGQKISQTTRQAILPAVDGKAIDTTQVQVQTISGNLATILVPSSTLEDSFKSIVHSSNIVRILSVSGTPIKNTPYSAYSGFHFSLGSYQFDTPWNVGDSKILGQVSNSKSIFTDIEPDRWSAGAIYLLASGGIVSGVGNGNFAPSAPVSRAAFFRMLSGVAQGSGIKLSQTETLPSDISDATWAKEDAAKVKTYVDSNEKGAFDSILAISTHLNPNSPITRAEAAQILSFFVGTDKSESGDWSFQDWNGGMEKERVVSLFQNGIIAGVSDTQFYPKGILTREQMAAIIARMNYVTN